MTTKPRLSERDAQNIRIKALDFVVRSGLTGSYDSAVKAAEAFEAFIIGTAEQTETPKGDAAW